MGLSQLPATAPNKTFRVSNRIQFLMELKIHLLMIKTYISKIKLPDCDKGTKFFLQDGWYYYKTRTESDAWYRRENVEGNEEFFELMNSDFVNQVLVGSRSSQLLSGRRVPLNSIFSIVYNSK